MRKIRCEDKKEGEGNKNSQPPWKDWPFFTDKILIFTTAMTAHFLYPHSHTYQAETAH